MSENIIQFPGSEGPKEHPPHKDDAPKQNAVHRASSDAGEPRQAAKPRVTSSKKKVSHKRKKGPRPVKNGGGGRKKLILCISALFLLVAAIAFIVVMVRLSRPNRTQMDRISYFGLEDGVSYGLIVNEERLGGRFPIRHSGMWYLDADTVNTAISSKFYFDGEKLLYTDPQKTWEAVPGENGYTDEEGLSYTLSYDPCYIDHDTLYIALDYIQLMDYDYWSVDMDQMYVWVWNDWEKKDSAELSEDSVLRTGSSIHATVVEELSAGDRVFILESGEKWDVVQAADSGLIGCVRKKDLGKTESFKPSVPDGRSLPNYTTRMLKDQVCMAWHQVFTKSGVDDLETLLQDADSINVMCPTWITVKNEAGEVQSLADEEYVQICHDKGIKVWVMVDNINIEVDEAALLSSTASRRQLIDALITEVERVGADGINLDFEAVGADNGPALLQFMRELSAACRNSALTLSVDNYSPYPHTAYYDRAQQAEILDYIVVMAYDEHYGGDDDAGSTSSMGWVKQSAERTLLEVPAEKLIVGLPFYSRLWKETPAEYSSEGAKLVTNDNSIYGTYELTSKEVGMTGCRNIVKEHKLSQTWLEEEQQYYVEYEEDNSLYRLWIEDSRSMKVKLDTAFSYSPAGVAFFKIGLETSDVWPLIAGYY